MRQGSNGRRPRGRPHRKQHGGAPRHSNFDSNGPEGRIRGNAHQVYEKYIALARDAFSAGDRIAAETYYQHAEHYYRILNARSDPRPNGEGQPGRQDGNGQAEADADAAGTQAEVDGQPRPVAGAGEQPREAAPARRGTKQAPAAEPEPEERSSEDSEPTDT
ncbi:MAG: DUF4167 domain-containing protein [Kiloniellales bacterium]